MDSKIKKALMHVNSVLPEVTTVLYPASGGWRYMDDEGMIVPFGTNDIEFGILEEALNSVNHIPSVCHICECGPEKEPGDVITVSERHLSVKGKPEELKLIALALDEFAVKRGIDLPKHLSDLRYAIEINYQAYNGLDESDWDMTPEDAEEYGIETEESVS